MKIISFEEYMLQSIVFDKTWTLAKAKAWLKKHKYKSSVDEKANTWRFRQTAPNPKKRYFTVPVHTGIKFVMMA